MRRSELRQLARQHANGKIGLAEFRRRRDQLIDDIVEGRVDIVREASPDTTAAEHPPTEVASSVAAPPPAAGTLSAVRIGLGLAVLAIAAWLIFPDNPDAPPPSPVPQSAPTEVRSAPGPGERIVEEFLAAGSWSEASLDRFELVWNALTEVERDEAQRAASMTALSRALAEEMKARQAVYDLNASAANRRALVRLYAVGQLLGAENALPEPTFMELLAEAALAENDASNAAAAEAPTVTTAPPSSSAESLRIAASADPTDAAAADEPELEPRAAAWKGLDDASGFTLQLFALSSADNVQKVLDSYPDLDLRVLTYASGVRHRIVYGAFEAEAEAAAAYARLPADLTRNQPKPVIRSIEALRAAAEST